MTPGDSMAQVQPFRAFRYNPARAPFDRVLTQPYDKISPAMQEKYYAADPNNLIAVEKGRSYPDDSPQNNVYTRAAAALEHWIHDNIVLQDSAPAFYAYTQEYAVPGTGDRHTRRGFIGAGKVEDYSAGVVHRLWAVAEPERVEAIQKAMAEQKLVIADGHHRYETALNYRNERRAQSGKADPNASYEFAMMTFVNMYSEGLTILPTHRVAANLHDFSWKSVRRYLEPWFAAEAFSFGDDAEKAIARAKFLKRLVETRDQRSIGVYPAVQSRKRAYYVLTLRYGANLAQLLPNVSPLQRELDVVLLHDGILEPALGITPQAVTSEKNLAYEREAAAGLDAVDSGAAQIALLLNACAVEQVMRIATGGEVLPQKSTDFYPKLLSGITMYRV